MNGMGNLRLRGMEVRAYVNWGFCIIKKVAAHVKNGRKYGTYTRHIWGNKGEKKVVECYLILCGRELVAFSCLKGRQLVDYSIFQ